MLATVLIINKSFMRTFQVHINKFTSKFSWKRITNKIRNRLTSGIKNDRITCITEQTDLVTFSVFTSWPILLTLPTLCWVSLLEQTGLLIVDGLTSSRTLLALQTLIPVALLEQTILLTFNELLALLAL